MVVDAQREQGQGGMSLFDFTKAPVKMRLIYALISATVTTFLSYILFTVFDMADFGLGYYMCFLAFMFIFGFFSAGYIVKNTNDQ
ncbi:hypothetical protein CW736_12430 [Nonlabens sp. MB-3u-79]|nr:hypothetical protein CW736_12430 [Nonlabens sp. MB-3u-79]|tara:strand:+ start:1617 stop:1871 length:255 start_codon:yes stop_codon:yes gene_type:complete